MPTNRNLNQRIKAALYSLKKQYGGGPVSIYTFAGTTTNVDTGVKTVNKSVTVVKKAIILPAKVSREVLQSISQISANKAFVYGGTFDSRMRTFIIERRDAPDVELKDDDWLVFDERKYEIKSIQEFEFDTAWVVVARQILGEVPEQIHPLAVDHLLDIESVAAAELN
jgi:hypothetical protein